MQVNEVNDQQVLIRLGAPYKFYLTMMAHPLNKDASLPKHLVTLDRLLLISHELKISTYSVVQ